MAVEKLTKELEDKTWLLSQASRFIQQHKLYNEFMNSSRQAANTQVPLYFTTISLLFFKFHNSEAVKISEGYSENQV